MTRFYLQKQAIGRNKVIFITKVKMHVKRDYMA